MQTREGFVERHFKGIVIGLVVVLGSFFGAPSFGSELTETELRAVIGSWRHVKNLINNGRPISPRAPVHHLYGARWSEDRLTSSEKAEILEIARRADPWRDVWFIGVKYNRRGDFNTIVYFLPDQIEGRLRKGKAVAVGSSWYFGGGGFEYVQVGTEPLEEFQPRAANIPFCVPKGLSDEEILEVVDLIYLGPKKKYVKGPHELPGRDQMRNPFLRDNTGRVDVPVLSPKYAMRGLYWFDLDEIGSMRRPDRTNPILDMQRSGDAIRVNVGERRHGLDGIGQRVECKKEYGIWVVTGIGLWVN